MFGLGFIEILILIVVLVAFSGLRRSGAARGGFAAVLLGGLALLALIMLGAGLLWLSFRGQPLVQYAAPAVIESAVQTDEYSGQQVLQYSDAGQNVTTHTSWNFRIVPVWVILFGVFAAVMILRRIFSPASACGHRRIWPALVAIPLLAFLFLGTARYQVRQSHVANNLNDARQQAEMKVAKVRAQVEAKRAERESRNTKRVAQMDIHELMDQFDAPRIPLSAVPGAAAVPHFVLVTPPVVPEANKFAAVTEKASKGTIQPRVGSSKLNRSKATSAPPKEATPVVHAVAQTKPKSTSSNEAIVESENKTAIDAEAKKDSPAILDKSLQPYGSVEKTASRPAWVDQPPMRTGNTRREVVATEEYESTDECYLAGDIYLLLKTWQRMQQLGGVHAVDQSLPSISFRDRVVTADGTIIANNGVWTDYRLSELNRIGINADYLRRELISKDPTSNEPREYLETPERSFGPMKKLYLQIEFSPNFDRELERHWRAFKRGERFEMVGVGAASILGLLGLAFALLKVDTATKGYYTKRLFIGVPLAILGLFGLYAMLVEMGVQLSH